MSDSRKKTETGEKEKEDQKEKEEEEEEEDYRRFRANRRMRKTEKGGKRRG